MSRTSMMMLILWMYIASAYSSGGHDIWNYLFGNNTYNKEVRPVKDWSTPTVVNISLSIIAVIDFNEVKQTIFLTSKVSFFWVDEFLQWNPTDFENISHIHLEQTRVWKPYIFLENSVTKQTELGTNSLKVIVNHDGKVEWNPTEVFQTTCAADVRKFPFDTQKCSMVFEAFGYTGKEVKMQSLEDHIDFHGYGSTAGWTIVETEMEAIVSDDGDDDIHIICSLTLRRNPVYFILNVFLPIVLLSFMNICVFILPVQSGEKASFVITVFLALAVFLTIVSGNLPENSDNVSMLNVYVFISTLLSVLIAIVTIVQIRLYHRDPELPVPNCLQSMAHLFTTHAKKFGKGKTTVKIKHSNGRMSGLSHDEEQEIPTVAYNTFFDEREKVTWPFVVKAFDNIFLLFFLVVNLTVTIVIFALAVRNEELQEDAHGEH
ncbi:neuronal acetylcholine receptor subunit alpha-7-like [Mya arenaria]|uniref:neuronal acetylcholine receptor subunit alpha-7-like n=1 Tax=Mya arenaria TaxID=6604 RepID=UPI0022DEEE21|nr:neuronal acetylcholine receptor subunit alpha-7-like [Mya arenaria]